uniref:Nudix hydrolase domain-containing protein n=1 Tax=Kalanchoe fedtschenkoi TaxID=63787 RepID=A0A7N0VIN1_KALFE
MFPKGGWELDETIEEAAERETFEEAGVAGVIDRERLGKWCYKGKTNGIPHEGYMYPLFVTDQSETWPEKNTRIRTWMKVDEARASNMPPWMKQALEALLVRLQNPLLMTWKVTQ